VGRTSAATGDQMYRSDLENLAVFTRSRLRRRYFQSAHAPVLFFDGSLAPSPHLALCAGDHPVSPRIPLDVVDTCKTHEPAHQERTHGKGSEIR